MIIEICITINVILTAILAAVILALISEKKDHEDSKKEYWAMKSAYSGATEILYRKIDSERRKNPLEMTAL